MHFIIGFMPKSQKKLPTQQNQHGSQQYFLVRGY